jgi:DNA-binding transcriptional ArsR family regulator
MEFFSLLTNYFENIYANLKNHFVFLRNIEIKNCYKMPDRIKFTDEIEQIARISKALSHPVRVYILQKLSKMDSCCYSGDLVEELPVGRSTLSRHLKELKYAGLIQGEINPPYIKYCINRGNWEKAKKLLDCFLNENQSVSISCEEKESVIQ